MSHYSPFVQQLLAIIDEKHLLTHPFYKAWEAGTLSQETLQHYAEQYYHLETAFPTFLSRMHTTCDDYAVRQVITENQYDEEHGEENHRELWMRFGEAVGATRENMQQSVQLPETAAAIRAFTDLSTASVIEGVGGLAAYESQLPAISESKVAGLQKHYNISDKRSIAFFIVHGIVDKKHADSWWELLDAHAQTVEEKKRVESAVERGRDALWNFLTGVCQKYNPELLTEAC